MFDDIEIIKWLYGIIIAPFVAWVVVLFRSSRKRKRRRNAIITHLTGLPSEAKSVLIEFYKNGTHTLSGNHSTPIMQLLVSKGVLNIGPGAGTYDAVNRYISVAPNVWECMDDWIFSDPSIDITDVFNHE